MTLSKLGTAIKTLKIYPVRLLRLETLSQAKNCTQNTYFYKYRLKYVSK